MKTLLACIVLVCAAFASDEPSVRLAKAACGPDKARFGVKAHKGQPPAPQPQPGKALVYVVEEFVRPANELGKPTIRVGVDGSWVGANRSTSYLFFAVDPGEHHLCTDWQAAPPWYGPKVSLASFKAEADGIYYFRARVVMDGSRGAMLTLDLEQMDKDEGRLLVASAPLSEYKQKK